MIEDIHFYISLWGGGGGRCALVHQLGFAEILDIFNDKKFIFIIYIKSIIMLPIVPIEAIIFKFLGGGSPSA